MLGAAGPPAAAGTAPAAIEPFDMRCEHLPDPAGVETQAPRLSWRCRPIGPPGGVQSAYRIAVAYDGATVWDTGRVPGRDGILIPYAGPALHSGAAYDWTVTLWDERGRIAPPRAARWRMGVLPNDAWPGAWITAADPRAPPPLDAAWIGYDPSTAAGPGHAGDDPGHTQYFRLDLQLTEAVAPGGATLFLAVDGTAAIFANGAYVAAPPAAFGATRLPLPALPAGPAVLAIQIGHGPGLIATPALAARLIVHGLDGGSRVAVSDTAWRVSDWAPDGWRMPDFDATGWPPAKILALPGAPPWGPVPAALPQHAPAIYLRSLFTPRAAIRRAIMHASGLGWSELFVNGARAGQAVLSPPLADYRKRTPYVTHDVTALLQPGANAIGAVLGRGRFAAPRPDAADFGPPCLRLHLVLDLADGRQQIVATGPDWRATTAGPIRDNNEYDGEAYDCGLEMPGWSTPAADCTAWPAAILAAGPAGPASSPLCAPTRVLEERRPHAVMRHDGSAGPRWIFDFGQNLAGTCRLRLPAAPAASGIRLRHAERLRPDGLLDTANLRSALATDTCRTRAGQALDWQPRFTTHGFRFVELTGLADLPPDALTACVIGDDLPPAGRFRCSDPIFNAVIDAAAWSVRSNCRSIRTDCPQRDERQGWLGDPAEDCRGEAFLFDNAAFYRKWLQDIADTQRVDGSLADIAPAYLPIYPGDASWPAALPAILDMLHTHHGDPAPIAQFYPVLRSWLSAMLARTEGGMLGLDRWGDWGAPAGLVTPGPLIATAYLVLSLDRAQRFAVLLGRPADAARWQAAAFGLRAGFHGRFYDPATGLYGGSPTGSILAMAIDLTPAPQQAHAAGALIAAIEQTHAAHPCYGLIGCQWVNRVLTRLGRPDLAFRLATQTTPPGLGAMIAAGATSLWELWDGDTADPAMSSLSHTMLMGDVVQWAFERLGGLRPHAPGFRQVEIAPHCIPQLEWAEAEHLAPTGALRLRWARVAKSIEIDLDIPPGTTASLRLPGQAGRIALGPGRHAYSVPG